MSNMQSFFGSIFLFSLLFLSHGTLAQEINEPLPQETDTTQLYQNVAIDLGEVVAYTIRFKNQAERNYYHWLEKRVYDVYPYLTRAVTEYYLVSDSARFIENNRARKKFINERYEKLADEYESKLKELTVSRGQILSKLMHRETKKSSYDLIKEMRGGMSAFTWSILAKAFSIDLKQGFDPKNVREDLYIEMIIHNGIARGRLQPIEFDHKDEMRKILPIIKTLQLMRDNRL